MKVIIHYKNGKKFTLTDLDVWYTIWHNNGSVYLHGDVCGRYYDISLSDVLFLEEIDKLSSFVKYHFNPNTPMSIIPDVMTAQQRAKANRNGIMQTVNNTLQQLMEWRYNGQ